MAKGSHHVLKWGIHFAVGSAYELPLCSFGGAPWGVADLSYPIKNWDKEICALIDIGSPSIPTTAS